MFHPLVVGIEPCPSASITFVSRENKKARMAHPQIKLGTDGWRGVIADDFTFANERTAAEAVASYVHASEDPAKGRTVETDTVVRLKEIGRVWRPSLASAGS